MSDATSESPPAPPAFLDVGRLLEASQPRRQQSWGWFALVGFGAVVLTGSWSRSQGAGADQMAEAALGMLMLAVVVAMSMVAGHTARAQREELRRLETVEELVQLRRWDQAALALDAMLAQPTRTAGARLQALIYLASVLARYHRFGDAITVQEYLLDHARLDPSTGHGIKLMRAMSMLHEDHLFDADRAIADLRRDDARSAGLALVEMYRDVKTGHPAEAIAILAARLPAMRAQLGTRLADAHALAARAHDLLDQADEARGAWARATLLAPPAELLRRYPELATMPDRYASAAAPPEMAATYAVPDRPAAAAPAPAEGGGA